MEVLFRAQVNFHPVYGLSLNIDDVDPDFTLGANERQKRLTIERLTKEGLMDLQRRLSLPELPGCDLRSRRRRTEGFRAPSP